MGEAGGAAEPEQGVHGEKGQMGSRAGYRAGKVRQWRGRAWGVLPDLTPFNTSSMWSRNCIKRLIFQLVLQFTELTWGRAERPVMPGRPKPLRSEASLKS